MLTKQALMKQFAQQCSCTKDTAELAFEVLEQLWTKALKNDQEIVIPGIGRLRPVKQAPRNARNPQTGEKFVAPAKVKVKFVIAAGLQEQLG